MHLRPPGRTLGKGVGQTYLPPYSRPGVSQPRITEAPLANPDVNAGSLMRPQGSWAL